MKSELTEGGAKVAKKIYSSKQELESGITSKIVTVLDGAVADKVKDMIAKSARKNVILDTGGRFNGGIDDISQMTSEVEVNGSRVELTVKDTAVPGPSVFGQTFDAAKDFTNGGTTFAGWIEKGQWMDLQEYLNNGAGVGGKKPLRPARPFLEPVRKKLEKNPNIITNILKRKM